MKLEGQNRKRDFSSLIFPPFVPNFGDSFPPLFSFLPFHTLYSQALAISFLCFFKTQISSDSLFVLVKDQGIFILLICFVYTINDFNFILRVFLLEIL